MALFAQAVDECDAKGLSVEIASVEIEEKDLGAILRTGEGGGAEGGDL